MFERLTARPFATLFVFAFIAILGAYTSPVSAQRCDGVTDKQIVDEIYAKLKADSKISPQISHINVFSRSAGVRLQGWADNKSDFDKIVKYVAETRCVRVINVNLFASAPPPPDSPSRPQAGGCAPGTKPCVDICIPEGDDCNIGGPTSN